MYRDSIGLSTDLDVAGLNDLIEISDLITAANDISKVATAIGQEALDGTQLSQTDFTEAQIHGDVNRRIAGRTNAD